MFYKRSQQDMRIDELEVKISKLAEKTAIWEPNRYFPDYTQYPINIVLELLLEKLGFELTMEEKKPKEIKLKRIKKGG